MKKIGLLGKRRDNVNNVLISLFITLIFGAITPVDVILVNQRNFSVSFSEMTSCLMLPCIIMFVALFLFLSTILLLNNKIYEITKTLLLSIVIALYLQELFLNGKMVRSDFDTAVGELSYIEESLNILIHFFVIVLPAAVIGYYLFVDNKKNTKDDIFANIDHSFVQKNLVVFVLGCISVMKSVGMTSDFFANDPKKYEQDYISDLRFFSYEPTVSFSKKNNVYVFIMDRFDSLWCEEFLEYYPEVKDEMGGFTFYQNNVSSYTNTFPSITNMFTNVAYEGSEWNEYFENAWNGDSVFSIARNKGYNVNLILDEANTYGASYRISSVCDNTVVPENLERIVDKDELRKIIFKLSFLRTVPYTLKYRLESVLNSITENTYIVYKFDDMEKIHTGNINRSADCKLYDYIETAEFDSNSEKKVLTAIHLNGAHDTNDVLINKMKRSNDKGDGLYMTLRANFETVFRYIRASKELDVFDNTTFIILGDHGRAPEVYYDPNNDKCLTGPIITALLIKPAHSENNNFSIDSESELSNTMLAASILEYAEMDHRIFGDSYNDIIKNKKEVSREFHTYQWNGTGRVDALHDYVIRGNARDFSNWKMVS